MSLFKIRPHHGLCTLFFVGKGYDNAFIENMDNILLSKQENPLITLTLHDDVICSCCPNLNCSHICSSEEKVNRYDKAVLALCHLNDGDTLLWNDFSDLVINNILDAGMFKSVCGDCEWHSICQSQSPHIS